MKSIISQSVGSGERKALGVAVVAALVATTFLGACAPTYFTRERLVFSQYNVEDKRQEKDGLVFEDASAKELPPSFFAEIQACSGPSLLVNQGVPVMERASFLRPGQVWFQVALTNNTDHVLRLNSAVIRLFDPAGNQNEPLSKDDLFGEVQLARPCASTMQLQSNLRLVKMIERNTELLPNATVKGFMAFKPASLSLPGMWKLTLYEVPVKVDDAGKVTKTVRFELRRVLKKFQDRYEQKPFAEATLLETKEMDQ